MQTLNLITWNVRGFHTTSKRIQIINHLIKLKADICFLQETHLTNKEPHRTSIANNSTKSSHPHLTASKEASPS